MIAQGGLAVFLGHQQNFVRMGIGALVLNLFNPFRRDSLQQLTGFLSGKPQLFPDQLVFVFVFLSKIAIYFLYYLFLIFVCQLPLLLLYFLHHLLYLF